MLTGLGRRWRAASDGSDAGVSLIELVVAMTLTVILGAVTLSLFLSVNSSSAATTDRTIGAASARDVLQSWSSYLQVADGTTAGQATGRFEWITPADMLFRADLGNRAGTAAVTTPTLIWLRLDGNRQLVEEQFASTPTTFPATYTACRILATNVTALTFTGYSGAAGGGLGSAAGGAGNGCIQLASAGPLTTGTALDGVTSVGIDITITASDGTRPQEYATIATVPALGGS